MLFQLAFSVRLNASKLSAGMWLYLPLGYSGGSGLDYGMRLSI
jgi:hypothetical protein